MLFVERAAAGAFGAGLPQDVIAAIAEQATPLGIGTHDLKAALRPSGPGRADQSERESTGSGGTQQFATIESATHSASLTP